MTSVALRVLLFCLGHGLSVGSRFMPALRAQITRTLTFEISAGDDVARYWRFDSQRRRIRTGAGHGVGTDGRVNFTTSFHGLRRLVSPRAVDRIIDDYHHGSVHLEGSALMLLWFYGLTRKLVKIGREPGPRRAVPGAYLAHDPGANGVEKILIEPAVVELDPRWADAWNARAKLWIIRGATGEPMTEP